MHACKAVVVCGYLIIPCFFRDEHQYSKQNSNLVNPRQINGDFLSSTLLPIYNIERIDQG